MKKILYTLLLFIVLTTGVNAASYRFFNVTEAVEANNGSNPKCPGPIGNITLRHNGLIVNVKGHEIRSYDMIRSNGQSYGECYCLAPKKTMADGAVYKCVRSVTPQVKSKNASSTQNYQAFDVAATYAYQQMVKNTVYNDGTNQKNAASSRDRRLIGTIAFRFLARKYGVMDVTYNGVPQLSNQEIIRYKWSNRYNTTYWNINADYFKKAVKYAEKAAVYGDQIANGKTTYEELVKKGIIWADEWEFNLVNSKLEGKYLTINFEISAKNGHVPKKVLWEEFDITCNNGLKCEVLSKKEIENGNKGRYQLKIDVSNLSNKSKAILDGITVTTAFQDQRDPTAHMFIVDPPSKALSVDRTHYVDFRTIYQRYLVIKKYGSQFVIQTEVTFDVPTTKCSCEQKNGDNTGYYLVTTTDEFGNSTTQRFAKGASELSKLDCPSKCDTPHYCEAIKEDGNTVYYGKDGNKTTKDKYQKECFPEEEKHV